MRIVRLLPYLPKIGSELLLAAAINGVFFVLAALLLWPFGKPALVGHLALGWCLYVVAGGVALAVSVLLHWILRIRVDPPSDACIVVNLAAGAALQLGWAAFAALAVTSVTPGVTWAEATALHVVGVLSSSLSTVATGAFFQGSVYKTANGLLALAGYLIIAVWPGVGRALYGWLFALF